MTLLPKSGQMECCPHWAPPTDCLRNWRMNRKLAKHNQLCWCSCVSPQRWHDKPSAGQRNTQEPDRTSWRYRTHFSTLFSFFFPPLHFFFFSILFTAVDLFKLSPSRGPLGVSIVTIQHTAIVSPAPWGLWRPVVMCNYLKRFSCWTSLSLNVFFLIQV